MQYLLHLLSSHGPLIILAVAFLEALGFPLPTLPFLVLSGCLIAEKTLSWPLVLLGAMAGTMAGDLLWFWLGKRLGSRALDLLCKLSINPDACVDRSEKLFRSGSTATVLTAKLVPGLNTLVPSLAGIMRMPLRRYAMLDAAGSLLWAGAGLSLGMAFGRGVLIHLASVQHALLLLLIGMVGFYIVFRIAYRIYLIMRYSVPRIEADSLHEKLASGESAVVVDLRNNSAYMNSLQILPGAIRIPPADFERKVDSLPRERDIIFYCT
jgi:membrane protein DedA with SNARE-associated domain